jgi:hypothetical protein
MIHAINLGFGNITIDRSKFSGALKEILGDDTSNDKILGLWVQVENKIYLARELNNNVKWQTLVHEIAEAIISCMEIKYSHDKVLILETVLSNILKNKLLIEGYWRAQDAANH